VAALVAYLAASVGLPLPVPTLKKSDQPFPCQNRPCGCQTAEQFWTGCCCFTPEERWAWARANKVQPPAYAERPSTSEACANALERSCCRAREASETEPRTHSCCQQQQSKPSCCQKPSPLAGEQSPQPVSAVGWLIGSAALKCNGGNILWLSLGAESLPTPPLAWKPVVAPIAWLAHSQQRALAHPSSPLTPPPRSSGR